MQIKKEKLKTYVTNNIDKIYRLAFSYAKNQADAEDIVNESIKRALHSINSLKKDYYMSTWLYRIVVNTANTYAPTAMNPAWPSEKRPVTPLSKFIEHAASA